MAKKDCTVCYSNLSEDMFQKITDGCTHPFSICTKCVHKHIINIVKGGSFAVVASYGNMACPNLSCNSRLQGNEIKRFLNKEEYDRWDRLAFQEWTEAQPEFRWCSQNNCGSGQLVDGGADANSFFRCVKCNNMTCIKHMVPFHSGMSCDEYDKTLAVDEQALANWKALHTKPCPKCRVPIEKNGGCDHMRCRSPHCLYEFCWSCLAEFDLIRRHGNHHHRPTCRFFAEYNGK
jgi:hypothetical protein